MKIGVMSDTHGNLDSMRRAAKMMVDKHGVDTIIHLGDDSTDTEELASLPIDLYWVPGIFEDRYQDPSIANRTIYEFNEVPFLLTHTPTTDKHDLEGDIDPTQVIMDGDVKVILHGHSHLWRIDEERGVIIINPGHLMGEKSKGADPSFAIIEVSPERLNAKIFTLDGNLEAEKTFFYEL